MFGSINEDWWDNMSAEDQAEYIQAHPKSQKAQDAKGKGAGEEKPTGPSSAYGPEWGDDPQASPGYTRADSSGKPDEDDYDMGVVPGSREEWEDIEPGDPEMRTGDESQEELGNMIKQQQNYIEDLYEKGADREEIEAAEANREDMEREMEEKEDAEEKRGSEYSEDDPPPENKGDPDWEEFNLDAWGEKLDRAADDGRISGEDYKELEGTLEKIEDAYASGDVETAEKLSAEYRRKTSGKFPWRGEESDDEEPTGPSSAYGPEWGDDPQASPGYTRSSRTGNELNKETLTINGKQYRRISESVEQKPKPKHAFSEFYQRFKKQE